MAGSYLLYNELHYNGLMTDWVSRVGHKLCPMKGKVAFTPVLRPFVGTFSHARVTRAPSLGFCIFCFHNLHTLPSDVSLFQRKIE